METPTNTAVPAGSSPAPAASTPPNGAPAAPAAVTPGNNKPDVKSLMAQMTPEQRRLAATGKLADIKPAAPAAPDPKAAPAAPAADAKPAASAVEPVVTPPANPEPAPEKQEPAPAAVTAEPSITEDTPEQGQAGENKGKRFRFNSEQDQAIAALAKSKGISLLEAAKLYEGAPASAPAAPAATASPAEASTPDPEIVTFDKTITDKAAEIEKLTTERDAAAEDMDHKAAARLTDQITDLKADLRILNNDRQATLAAREKEQKSARVTVINQSRDRVFAEFPVFAKEDTIERQALDNYVSRAMADPSRKAEFAHADWPERFAREFAKKHGIKAGTAGIAPAAPAAPAKNTPITRNPPQQVTAPSGAKLITGADGHSTPSTSRPTTPERVKELINTDPTARREIVKQLFQGKRR